MNTITKKTGTKLLISSVYSAMFIRLNGPRLTTWNATPRAEWRLIVHHTIAGDINRDMQPRIEKTTGEKHGNYIGKDTLYSHEVTWICE